jgi:prevent-host-death family protein
MRTVGIKTLKNKLSEYIRAAAGGETVLVTDRDRVVAEIVPPRAAADATPAERKWADLVRQGLVAPAGGAARLPPRRFPRMPLDELMMQLDADRSDR